MELHKKKGMTIMAFVYYLPSNDNVKNRVECGTNINSVIIIGANGSGKSKLGAWIEQSNPSITHRIGAQRSLIFGSYIKQMSYEQATHKLLSGTDTPTTDHKQRWNWDGEKYNYTSSLLNDYEDVLSAIWAKQVKQESEYVKQCKEMDFAGEPHKKVPEMIMDVLNRIWSSVFPHRNISFDDGKVTAIFSTERKSSEYKGRDMSDGERVALYLICQSLCIPSNKIIIIDEPELHLHRSIMNRLWTAIEQERQDCLFMYITHDTQFAAAHTQSTKIWVKSYDGEAWKYSFVEEAALPNQLLLDIMGNRRKVLFVEGTNDSYDTLLYTHLFSEYYIVPCGSCRKVIEQTKAMRANAQLHDLECYGLIDCDYRSEREKTALKGKGVYTLSVSEVENLFIVEELLKVVNQLQGFTDNSRVDQAKKYIIEKRYKPEIEKQICAATIAEIKYQLSIIDISGTDDTAIQNRLSAFFDNFNYLEMKQPFETLFMTAYNEFNYKKVISIYNRKSLKNSIGSIFGLQEKDYCDFIIRQLNGPNSELIKRALRPYLPSEIPL